MPRHSWLTGLVRMNAKHGENNVCKDDSVRSKQETVSTASTGVGDEVDPEMMAINRFTSRNHRRRLSRTRSSSDIIRDSRHNQVKLDSSHKTVALDSIHSSVHVLPDSGHRSVALSQLSNQGDTSYHASPSGTGQKKGDSSQKNATSSSLEQSRTATASPQPAGFGFGGLDNILSHPFFFSNQQQKEKQEAQCFKCTELNTQLVAALEDLEYMRGLALQAQRSQPLKDDCGDESNKFPASVAAAAAAAALVSSPTITGPTPSPSQQLQEIITRHQKQVEQSTKERIRWQQEMHLKLNKYATICKSLNEESAALNNECISLREELGRVQAERNDASEELLLLRAEATQVRIQRAEMEQQQARLRDVECLNVELHRSLQSRDAMIDELTSKLNLVLQQLEFERQQRQRRPFQFPFGP